MAVVIGHYKTLAEAEKLTQSRLIPGVIEEDILRGNPLELCPVAQADGLSIKWNREKKVIDYMTAFAVGQEFTFSADMEYETIEVKLKRAYLMRRLDQFVIDVYGTMNDYKLQTLAEMRKGVLRALGAAFIYGDDVFGDPLMPSGLHQWAAASVGTDLDIDNGEVGLSLHNLRTMINAMKGGCDVLLFPTCIWQRMAEAYEERGLAQLATGTAGTMASISKTINDIGKPVWGFDGIPIYPTDFLVEEEANTGRGANKRAEWTTGTANYSVFGVKWGDITKGENGLAMGIGGNDMGGDLFRVDYFPKEVITEFDGPAMRLITYGNTLLGSTLSLGRIHDITNVGVIA
jgi:hypothetical protein